MRILDEDNGKLIDSVLLMLTQKEAQELSSKIRYIDIEKGEHIHVNDLNFTKQITVLIYTPENLKYFREDIKKAITEDNNNIGVG